MWKGILEENFVLSFSNNVRIEVQYNIDNQMSNWRVKMESYMEDILEKFCGDIKADFKAKDVTPGLLRAKTFLIDNVPLKFANEIGLKYGHVASFRKIYDKFGMYLQWVKLSHVEPIITNVTSRIYRKHFGIGIADTDFFQNMQDLVAATESKLLHDVIGLYNVAGLTKMQFQSDSAIFACGSSVKQYLAKAIDLLVKTHEESYQEKFYNLTDTLKVIFLFNAAQLTQPNLTVKEKISSNFLP